MDITFSNLGFQWWLYTFATVIIVSIIVIELLVSDDKLRDAYADSYLGFCLIKMAYALVPATILSLGIYFFNTTELTADGYKKLSAVVEPYKENDNLKPLIESANRDKRITVLEHTVIQETLEKVKSRELNKL